MPRSSPRCASLLWTLSLLASLLAVAGCRAVAPAQDPSAAGAQGEPSGLGSDERENEPAATVFVEGEPGAPGMPVIPRPDPGDRCSNCPPGGCPGLDCDGDGIADHNDMCPGEPEDRDGFEDADGCPEFDNDGDGVADVDDMCPNQPEDLDGFEDDDGCHEHQGAQLP